MASRVGVLDLQLESDGRVRSTAPLLRLADGRIALGFAALAAGLNVRQASAAQRILIAPYAPMTDTPTYSLATLLDCLASQEGLEQVRRYIEGRIVVVGTAVLGEDEHRGPTRFLGGGRLAPSTDRCAPHIGLFKRPDIDNAPGALMQIAAIQSAASERPVSLAPKWLRLIAGAGLTLLFALMAFRDESALALGERDVSPASILFVQLARSVAFGLVGPDSFRLLDQRRCVHIRRHLAPNGLSHTRYNFSICSHRWYQISPPSSSVQKPVPNRRPLFAPSTARDVGS